MKSMQEESIRSTQLQSVPDYYNIYMKTVERIKDNVTISNQISPDYVQDKRLFAVAAYLLAKKFRLKGWRRIEKIISSHFSEVNFQILKMIKAKLISSF